MKKAIFFLTFALSFLFPAPTYAHAFGQLYNLPVPFWFYLYCGAVTIAASFIIIAYFVSSASATLKYPTYNLSKFQLFKVLTKKASFIVLKIISVFLFILTVLSGYIGTNDPRFNFNMTFFWIIFMLLFVYAMALVGNIWSVINPWQTIVVWFEQIFKVQTNGRFNYPKNLAYYPAFILYFIFIWVELVGEVTPIKLSVYLSLYTEKKVGSNIVIFLVFF